MEAVFAPAIALMNRLRFPKKFMLLGIVVIINVSILLYSLVAALNESITYSRGELAGIKSVIPILKLIQGAQVHRGLSASVINGASNLQDKLKGKQSEVDALFKEVDAALPEKHRNGDGWKITLAEWQGIAANGMEWTSLQSFRSHTEMIEQLLDLQVDIADETGLMLDPDADSYYLMETAVVKFPNLLERLGRIRAKGASALAQKKAPTTLRVELGILEAEIQTLSRAAEKNVQKVVRQTPALEAQLTATTREMKQISAQILQVVSADILLEQFTTPPVDYFKLVTTAIDTGYKQIYDTMYPALKRLIEARIEKAERSRNLNVAICLLAFAVLCYLMIGASLAISRNLEDMGSAANRMAEGDLRTPINVHSDDELSDAASRFNTMVSAFNNVLRSVQGSAVALLGAARKTNLSAQHISVSSQKQSEAASSMAAAVEETTVGVDHIAKNAFDASAISSKSGELSEQGAEIVATVAAEMSRIAQAVNESASTIGELGEQSKQISAIVGTIKDIADQTNLLALNAAIEAARAGESGRGFAVVADEVRKLAERTSHSTQEIAGMVGAIQHGTERAVASMKSGVARVSEGVAMTERAGASMSEIRHGAHQVVEVVGDISSALREQSAASADIAQNVESIARMAEENNAAVASNAATAQELEQLATRLQQEIARFKVA